MFIKYQPLYTMDGDIRVTVAERFEKDVPGISVWRAGQTRHVPESLKFNDIRLVDMLTASPDFITVGVN